LEELERIIITELGYDILTAERFKLTNRCTTAIANALMADLGIVDENEFLGRTKVQNMFERHRSSIADSHNVDKELICIKFDGRRDKTIDWNKRFSFEEHISVISEPGHEYLDHFTPKSGRAVDITQELYDLLLQYGSNSSLIAIGADSTATNTGRHGGAIRLLEERLQRPLFWIICLLHFNELPLRHLFKYYDGGATGPRTFSGSIGQSIENLRLEPIVEFEPLDGPDTHLPKEFI
jgi:hypothetical protein